MPESTSPCQPERLGKVDADFDCRNTQDRLVQACEGSCFLTLFIMKMSFVILPPHFTLRGYNLRDAGNKARQFIRALVGIGHPTCAMVGVC